MLVEENITNDDIHRTNRADTTHIKRLDIEFFTFSYFSLIEPSGGVIDVKRSFISEESNVNILFIRLIILIWSIASIVWGAFTDDDEYFYLAYLSNWTALVSLSFLTLTLWLTIYPSPCQQPHSHDVTPSRIVKVTWTLYAIAAPAELVIILLFWTLDYDPSKDGAVTYCMVFEHGILALIVLVDGNLISRIPLRLKHGITYQTYNVCYLVWTVIFAACNMDKSPIYDVLDWNNDLSGAVSIASMVLILICPCVFVLCWMLSLQRRRLFNEIKGAMVPSTEMT